MNERKIIWWGLLLTFFVSLVLGGIIFYLNGDKDEFEVTFFDVGQGDSILISSGSSQMLVDGGGNGKILLEKLGRNIPFWDREIEVLVLTHPDSDHLGGLLSVLESYDVKMIIKTGFENKTKVEMVWNELLEKEGANVIEAVQGTKIRINENLMADVLHPFYSFDVSKKGGSNDSSVVLKFESKQKNFLLMGDVSKKEENEMIENRIDLKSDVLKIAHHGSRNSLEEKFLDLVGASDAIVSAGKENRYGHPHKEVIDALRDDGVEIFRTDEMGDVSYECDENGCELMGI